MGNGERKRSDMKSIVIWFAKKYALDAVKDAVSAKSDDVSKWSKKVGVWLGKIRLMTAFLERLAERLSDGALSDAEAERTIEESQILAKEVMA